MSRVSSIDLLSLWLKWWWRSLKSFYFSPKSQQLSRETRCCCTQFSRALRPPANIKHLFTSLTFPFFLRHWIVSDVELLNRVVCIFSAFKNRRCKSIYAILVVQLDAIVQRSWIECKHTDLQFEMKWILFKNWKHKQTKRVRKECCQTSYL